MARIDYTGILEAIGAALQEDAQLQVLAPRILVEEDPVQGGAEDSGRSIVLVNDSRTPSQTQVLAAGTRQRYHLRSSVWCCAWDMESFLAASRKRDELIGETELAIMRLRNVQTLSDRVSFIALLGGEFLSARNQNSTPTFGSMGQIILEAEVSAIV